MFNFSFSKNFVGISNKFKLSVKISLILLVIVYFIFHTLSGKNGMRSYFEIKRMTTEQTQIAEKLKKEKESLEKNVSLLGNNALDLDILEERCRVVLNYAFPDDIIVDEKTIY